MNEKRIGNRYELLDVLGSGGEAKVFRALDTNTGVEVALRVALNSHTPATPVTFPDFHPGWVNLLDSGIDPENGAYQALELLKGETIGQRVQSGPLAPEPWHSFLEQSLNAVEALHLAGWVHGDLNTENFIQTDSSESPWKLLELPFLRLEPPTGRTALFGSIHTLAPEQLNGKPTDASSDLYALGCLYYYAACGTFPHAGGTSQDIAIYRLRFDPDPLPEKAPHLPTTWSGGVMALLSREPQNRPSSAAARHLLGVA